MLEKSLTQILVITLLIIAFSRDTRGVFSRGAALARDKRNSPIALVRVGKFIIDVFSEYRKRLERLLS